MIEGRTVKSIEDLVSYIKKDYSSWKTTTYPWFRGEKANTSTPLLPKLYRRIGKHRHSENSLLQQFRMKAPSLGLMNTPDRNHTDEWLFLAQHVGLPTRLLDWTEGLFIAVYFALLEKKPVVWMLDPVELNRRSTNQKIEDNIFPLTWFSNSMAPTTKNDISMLAQLLIVDPSLYQDFQEALGDMTPNLGNINIRGAWENDSIGTEIPVAIHPTNIHTRMSSQKSCFTIHGKKQESLSNLVSNRILKKYIIPPKLVNSMKKDLRLMGITHTTAFPDLDNLALDLSEIF